MKLQEALEQQVSQLSALKQILESELHLISSREPETLMALLKEKEEALSVIEKTDLLIAPLYEKSVESGTLDSDSQSSIDECMKIVEECKYLTQINAKSVEQGQLRLTHLRNLMMELRARETMTYDKSGRTKGDAFGGGLKA